ncbi:MAG TPA: SPW repeat protein [Lacipirellulaceae bacterium]|nr:SPW repeat protein [Lacipirellulaceae bacterium]
MSTANTNPQPRRSASTDEVGTKTAGGINILAGIGLIISPFILGYGNLPSATWNDVILGIIVLAVAWVRIANSPAIPGIAWINIIAGVWLFISPWIFQYYQQPTPLWNNLILGVIVFIFAIWGAVASPHRPAAG